MLFDRYALCGFLKTNNSVCQFVNVVIGSHEGIILLNERKYNDQLHPRNDMQWDIVLSSKSPEVLFLKKHFDNLHIYLLSIAQWP